MIYIILCGNIYEQDNYSLPIPLNYINGKHQIEYIIESIITDTIYIIYNIYLDNYNFCEIIINKYKHITFIFTSLDFLTRGAVESALIGIKNFNLDNDNIIFIDNDSVHDITNIPSTVNNSNFLFYSTIKLNEYNIKTNNSFITIKDNKIINIEEKNKISDYYCCGLYGFINKNIFIQLAEELIETNNNFYFSQIYKLLIQKKEIIKPILINNSIHLDSYDKIVLYSTSKQITKLRICFDLDNTLVSYPTIPGDYSSVKPITKNIDLLNKLKKDGHEIIIYTARRMLTHKSNIGKVMKDIAMITLTSLENLDIYYDEIIFGKPIADIYIDDRALNPYYNNISLFGIFNSDNEYILNKIENNKYNIIEKKQNYIYKTGPSNFIKGELYFYQNIIDELKIYFPQLISYNKIDESIELKLEHIKGVPLYYLYKNKTLTTKHIDNLLDTIDLFHSCNYNISINDSLIKKNYFDKLNERFNKNDYYFDDAAIVFNNILENLEKYYDSKIVSIIHGDCWFSNILLTYDNQLKFLDMKGKVYTELTINGDMYYDYGKIYQSILGYDLILHNDFIDYEYINKFKEYFIKKCRTKNLNINYLTAVTKSLIFGVFHSLKENDPKDNIWNFIKSITL